MKTLEEIREALARYSHDSAWPGWMKYMFSKGYYMPINIRLGQGKSDSVQMCWVMPQNLVERWQRQMNTAYDDLPENEKASDRKEADEMIAVSELEALRAEIARLRECVRLSEIYITSLEDFIAGETSFFVSEIRSLVDEKQAYTRAREAVG